MKIFFFWKITDGLRVWLSWLLKFGFILQNFICVFQEQMLVI